ncbi:MAG TPA: sugar ABC transporter permease [Clostridia bacterium]|nr:sugar ABC transporter permease [Clostridia bacterium]
MEKVLGDKKAICIFVLPALLVFLVIVVTPVFMSGYYSLLDWDGIGKSTFTGFDNYIKLFTDSSGFAKSIGNSFILAGLSIFIQLPIAMVLALILAQGIKWENFCRTVYFIPVIISTVVIGQLWRKVYHYDYGLLNSLLKGIGLENLQQEWLGSTSTALMSVLAPIIWQYIGYHMLLFYSAAKSVPGELYEAAMLDGASGFKTSIHITIPLIRPMINVCITYSLIGSLKVFDLIYVLTNGGPVHSTEVPSTLMFNTIFARYQYGFGSSMAIFIIVECLLLTIIIQRLFRSDNTAN